MEQSSMNTGSEATEAPENLADADQHIQDVLEAAQRAAAITVERARAEGERRVGNAKQQARELVDERNARVGEISDDLLRQATTIEDKLTRLDGALGTAMKDLRRELEVPEHPEDKDELDSGAESGDAVKR